MLMGLLFWRKHLSASVCWPQHADISQIYLITDLGRCVSHAFKIIIKMSKWWVSVSVLWTLNPAPGARAALFECMPFVRVLENITFCSLFANPFHDFNHHSNQQHPPVLLSSETWEAALSSLSLSVSRACNDVCVSLSDSFKCFHTALVRASIWSRNVIVQYKLFGLFAYSAEHSVHP